MTKRMLIDATHAEETRVVVLDGNRLEDFDVETSAKRHLKGNIYLAKVVRVEPSLQAAFVEYGGNRHGFLAFSEIHPDYYQIPVADRQRLLEMEAEEARREQEEDELELALSESATPARAATIAPDGRRQQHGRVVPIGTGRPGTAGTPPSAAPAAEPWAQPASPRLTDAAAAAIPPATAAWARPDLPRLTIAAPDTTAATFVPDSPVPPPGQPHGSAVALAAAAWARAATPPLLAPVAEPEAGPEAAITAAEEDEPGRSGADDDEEAEDAPPPETIGGDSDSGDDHRLRRLPPRFLRNYKIQEVIRRRQIMLVQVEKEERGTKGAALTTYLSLAGRFSVLMPNSPRGGGISRKITSAADRRRLKEVMAELDIPRGMGLIIRTAGAARPKPEIKRDCEYLLRLWDDIREHTLKSIAPALIYEEASLIKRAIRDVYSRDIDEILVDGVEGWRAAHEFMRMLMPTHARKVQLWRDQTQPLFLRYQVEAQLDAMLSPVVQLRSGGYLVINQAEALVAIDVNSGRSTRERNVEETALRTNLEAADEVARQLRLRDLAGLIVIDFIDMESRRHNAMVERRLKDALRNDRARIQVGHISHFGLLEMSRQRLRPSLAETSFVTCPHCGGTGHVRTTESAAIHVLRGIEDEASKRRSAEAIVHVATPIALYLLNHKRERLREIEQRYGMRVIIAADDTQLSPRYRIERVRAQVPGEAPTHITPDTPPAALPPPVEDELEDEPAPETPGLPEATEEEAAAGAETEDQADGEEGEHRRRRRRRRRSRREEDGSAAPSLLAAMTGPPAQEVMPAAPDQEDSADTPAGPAPLAEPPAPAAAPATAAAPGPDHAGASETPDLAAEDGTAEAEGAEEARARRRGRRGGRRRRRDGTDSVPSYAEPGAEQPDAPSPYAGPTPANPFGGPVFDIFDVMEQAEQAHAQATRRTSARAAEPAAPPVAAWARPSDPPLLRAPVVRPRRARGGAGQAVTAAAAPAAPAPAEPPAIMAPAAWASAAQPALLAEVARSSVIPAAAAAPPAAPQPPAAPAPAAEPAPPPEPDVAVDTVAPAQAPQPANDPVPPQPVVRPIIIGEDAPAPAERKRGWWRRS